MAAFKYGRRLVQLVMLAAIGCTSTPQEGVTDLVLSLIPCGEIRPVGGNADYVFTDGVTVSYAIRSKDGGEIGGNLGLGPGYTIQQATEEVVAALYCAGLKDIGSPEPGVIHIRPPPDLDEFSISGFTVSFLRSNGRWVSGRPDREPPINADNVGTVLPGQ